MREASVLMGIPVDDVDMDETVDEIVRLVADGRQTARCHQVATVNVDFVVNAMREPNLARVLRNASLSIPDGMPVVWGARALRGRIRHRVAGADLVPALAQRSAADGLRIGLFGAGPGIAARAAGLLQEWNPGAIVAGSSGPDFVDVEDLTIDDLDDLVESKPDVCCIAFGNPKQERFIERFGQELGIPVMIGVGGTLDFLVGEKSRAPSWMQRSGLEWLHRILTEPRRLVRRYARDARIFFPALAQQAWSYRRGRRDGEVTVKKTERRISIDLRGSRRMDNAQAHRVVSAARNARRDSLELEVVGPVGDAPAGVAEVLGCVEGS